MISSTQAWELIWLGRHLERAERGLRLLAGLHLASHALDDGGLRHVLDATLKAACDTPETRAPSDSRDEAGVWNHLLMSPLNPGSVRGCVTLARANARICRPLLTDEVWEALNAAHLHLAVQGPGYGPAALRVHAADIRGLLFAVLGALYSTQARDDVLHCIRLGEGLERLDGTARLILAHGAWFASVDDVPVAAAGVLMQQAGLRPGASDTPAGALLRLAGSEPDPASLGQAARRTAIALDALNLGGAPVLAPASGPSAAADQALEVAGRLHRRLLATLFGENAAPAAQDSPLQVHG